MSKRRSRSAGSELRRVAIAVLVCATLLAGAPPDQPPILDYIEATWAVLTRSAKDLAKAAPDPKFHPNKDGRWPIYIPQTGNVGEVENQLQAEMASDAYGKIAIAALPKNLDSLPNQGLLYLPRPYVVPGGRFNEMYGWDSYFIQVGLLRDKKYEMAKDMADNFLYQVRNYGKVLNANRTYYLDRSQPPFLTEMVLGVYGQTHDRKWLEDAVPAIDRYYDFWVKEPHLTAETGLSRYFSTGDGPSSEVTFSERNAQGKTHYDLVKEYYRTHSITDYDVTQYYKRDIDELTLLFYKGDRSMRESGFDPSNRFGPFSIDIIHYDPVCLNVLLYRAEQDRTEIAKILGRSDEAGEWHEKAQKRAAQINKLMWDEAAGLYLDYSFQTRSRRNYPFLTCFYPLWAGIASKEQAASTRDHLKLFERDGGLQTSTAVTGNQWDSPFGWAPLQMIAIDGLRRYGFNDDAERISMKFLSLVQREYKRQGFIVEKYDVVHGGSNVSGQIHFGYSANQAGFGWTNAAWTHLYDELRPEHQKQLFKE